MAISSTTRTSTSQFTWALIQNQLPSREKTTLLVESTLGLYSNCVPSKRVLLPCNHSINNLDNKMVKFNLLLIMKSWSLKSSWVIRILLLQTLILPMENSQHTPLKKKFCCFQISVSRSQISINLQKEKSILNPKKIMEMIKSLLIPQLSHLLRCHFRTLMNSDQSISKPSFGLTRNPKLCHRRNNRSKNLLKTIILMFHSSIAPKKKKSSMQLKIALEQHWLFQISPVMRWFGISLLEFLSIIPSLPSLFLTKMTRLIRNRRIMSTSSTLLLKKKKKLQLKLIFIKWSRLSLVTTLEINMRLITPSIKKFKLKSPSPSKLLTTLTNLSLPHRILSMMPILDLKNTRLNSTCSNKLSRKELKEITK